MKDDGMSDVEVTPLTRSNLLKQEGLLKQEPVICEETQTISSSEDRDSLENEIGYHLVNGTEEDEQ